MDAVKYFEEKRRMLDSLGRIGERCVGVACRDCPLSPKNNGIDISCIELEALYPERAVEIVEKWSKEHPRKTMLQDFLKKYPKAMLREDGMPYGTCPYVLGYDEAKECNYLNCNACWNRPLEE